MLVDFWAEWCGPCKMIAPILDQIAVEYQDRLDIAKVDVEGSQSTAMKYGIRSIPTLMLFKGGVVEAQHVGMLSEGATAEAPRLQAVAGNPPQISHPELFQSSSRFPHKESMHERLSRQFGP